MKFVFGQLPGTSVPRPRRVSLARERLHLLLAPPGVVALIAPPGSGKTHLAAEAHARALAAGSSALWISLKALAHATELTACPGTTNVRPSDLIGAAVDAVAGLDAPAIVIDDIEADAGSDFLELLAALGDRLPDGGRLMLAGRSAAAIAGAFPAVRCIDEATLRFTDAEAHSLLERRVALDHASAAEAVDLADGWALGLEIIAEGLRGGVREAGVTTQLCGPGGVAERFIRSAVLPRLGPGATGLVRLMADVGPLPPEILCGLAKGCGGVADLERLTTETPLVAGQREGAGWMLRPIAREVLLRSLPSSDSEAAARHLAAADWLVSAGRPADAVPHALKGGQIERACQLAERSLFGLSASGRIEEALAILRELPAEAVLARDGLRFAAAWTLATAGVRPVGEAAPAGLEVLTAPATPLDRDHAIVIQMLLAANADDPDWAIAARTRLGDRPLMAAFAATRDNISRWIARQRGDWCEPPGSDGAPFNPDHSPELLHTHCARAFRAADVLLATGDAEAAIARVQPLLTTVEAIAGRHSSTTAQLAAVLARAYLEAGQADSARELLRGRLHDIEKLTPPDAVWIGLSTAARLEAKEGRINEALAVLSTVEAHARSRDLRRLVALALLERARMASVHKRPELAHGVVDSLAGLVREARHSGPVNTGLVRLIAALGFAHCAAARCDRAAAASHVDEAERLAHGIGVPEHRRDAAALRQWLDGCGEGEAIGADGATVDNARADVCDLTSATASPFTAKETAILKLVADGLSNKAIARALELGDQTIKWHLKRIFKKIGVSNRQHAVERARALGFLPFAFAEM